MTENVVSDSKLDNDNSNAVVEDSSSNDSETRKIDLYNAAHGKAPRTGGPYQDDLVAEQAEIRRAKLEEREPDLENPPATAATYLVPKEYLSEHDTDKSHFSDRVEVENEPVDSVEYTPPENKPDPKQVDWNNDMSVVNAANAKVSLQKAEKEKDDDELSDEQKTVLESQAAQSTDEASRYRTKPGSEDKDKENLTEHTGSQEVNETPTDPGHDAGVPTVDDPTDEELFGPDPEPKNA